MTKKHIFIMALMAMPLLLTSCLKDQDDLFSDSASARTEKFISNARRVLTSATEGWVLNYYPDRDQSYGGYVYTLKFSNDSVTVRSEIGESPADSVVTLYTMSNESGPVITFDTYNRLMHHFATPTGSSGAGGYEAYDGDFMLAIQNISEDENTITLRGTRSGNIMYMHRLETGGEQFLTALKSVSDSVTYKKYLMLMEEGDTVTARYVDGVFTFSYNENGQPAEQSVGAIHTLEGISFYKPVDIRGHQLTGMRYVEQAGAYPATGDTSLEFIHIVDPINQTFADGLWFTSLSNIGTSYAYVWKWMRDTAAPWLKENEGEDFYYFAVGAYDSYWGGLFRSGDYSGIIGMNYQLEGDDTISMVYNASGNGGSALWYIRNILFHRLIFPFGCSEDDNMQPVPVVHTFKITTDNPRKPSYVTLTDVNDADNVITLYPDMILYPLEN